MQTLAGGGRRWGKLGGGGGDKIIHFKALHLESKEAHIEEI